MIIPDDTVVFGKPADELLGPRDTAGVGTHGQ
jgi:hypothetical protein